MIYIIILCVCVCVFVRVCAVFVVSSCVLFLCVLSVDEQSYVRRAKKNMELKGGGNAPNGSGGVVRVASSAAGSPRRVESPSRSAQQQRRTIQRTTPVGAGQERRRPRSGPSVALVNNSVSNMASRMQQQQDYYSQQQQQQLHQQQQRRSRLSGGRANHSSRTRPASSSHTGSGRNRPQNSAAAAGASQRAGSTGHRAAPTKRTASATLHRANHALSEKVARRSIRSGERGPRAYQGGGGASNGKTVAAMSSPSAHRHRRVAYPREMVNPVDDVIDSGVSRRSGGRRHLFNPELMRDGMWRELEPLVAFNVCTAAANEGQYGEMLKVQEQHVDLGDGEEGSIVRISVRLPGKCLIESLNIYSAVPVNLRSVEFRTGGMNKSTQEIAVPSTQLVPEDGLIKVFTPGMAEQIVVHLFKQDTDGAVAPAEDGSSATKRAASGANGGQEGDSGLNDPLSGATGLPTSPQERPVLGDADAPMLSADGIVAGALGRGGGGGGTPSPARGHRKASGKKVASQSPGRAKQRGLPSDRLLPANDLADDDDDERFLGEDEDSDDLEDSDGAYEEDGLILDDDDGIIDGLDDEEEDDGVDPQLIGKQKDLTVSIVGFSLQHAPPPAAVVPLMNVSTALRTRHRVSESVEADMLCGLALLRTRRVVQATEVFRRAEQNLFHEHAANVPFQKKALRAATFSLLAADGLSHVNQLYVKLVALHRATEYTLLATKLDNDGDSNMAELMGAAAALCYGSGARASIHPSTDVKTGLQSLQPHLTHILLSSLKDPMLPVREAGARGLQFVLDHIGCSIGKLFPLILQRLVQVYPVDVDLQQPQDLQRHLPEERAVLLLETCYGMLPYFSRHLLADTVTTVIEPYLKQMSGATLGNSASTRLSIILLRVLVLIIGRLRGDMPLRRGLVVALLRLSRHEVAVVHRSSRRCWEAIASNIGYGVRRCPEEAGAILSWCADEFMNVNRIRPRSARRGTSNLTKRMQDAVLFVAHSTDTLATAVATLSPSVVRAQVPQLRDSLLKLIPLLVKRIQKHCFSQDLITVPPHDARGNSTTGLVAFQTLWGCLVSVARAIPDELAPSLNLLALPLLKWAYLQSKFRAPSTALLGVLRTLLTPDIININETLGRVPDSLDPTPKQFANMDQDLSFDEATTMQKFFLMFLPIFAKWVPHSVKDDTFHVLKAIIHFTAESLTVEMTKVILTALLDKYTVRSKSYLHTVGYFVDVLSCGVAQGMERHRKHLLVSDLVEYEKERLADLVTKRVAGEEIPAQQVAPEALQGIKMFECFAFVVEYCTSMPSLPTSRQGSSGDRAFESTSLLAQGDRTEQRLFFLLLLLLSIRDQPSSPARLRECVGSLWQSLPRITAFCTSLLDHPRSDVQILAFHIMDVLSTVMFRTNHAGVKKNILSKHLLDFLLDALKEGRGAREEDGTGSPSLRLRCVFLVHKFVSRNGIDPGYKIELWERVASVVKTPWKNLRSVSLWVLGQTTELICNDDSIVATFLQKAKAVLPKLFDDDWECRLTAINILCCLKNRHGFDAGHFVDMCENDWHPAVQSAVKAYNARGPVPKENVLNPFETLVDSKQETNTTVYPAAHFKGLWEDHEKAFAELQSLEEFVRGAGTAPAFADRPVIQGVFESSVAVVPAPPEQAFLDSFLAGDEDMEGDDEDEQLLDEEVGVDAELGAAGVVVEEGDGSFEKQAALALNPFSMASLGEADTAIVSSEEELEEGSSDGSELQDQPMEIEPVAPSPAKGKRPRSAPAVAKALAAERFTDEYVQEEEEVRYESSSADGFVFDDESTASDDPSEDEYVDLRKPPTRKRRPTASSRTKRVNYVRDQWADEATDEYDEYYDDSSAYDDAYDGFEHDYDRHDNIIHDHDWGIAVTPADYSPQRAGYGNFSPARARDNADEPKGGTSAKFELSRPRVSAKELRAMLKNAL